MAAKHLLITSLFTLVIAGTLPAQNFYKESIPRVYTLTLAGGPASMYSDNGGPYRKLDFPIFGSVTLSAAKKINRRINLRLSAGYQHVSSNMEYVAERAYEWGEENKAYAFTGDAVYIDFMPEFYFLPYETHIERFRVNGYAGIGLGFMAIPEKQAYAYPNETEITVIESTPTALYLPVRLGGSVAFGPNWDVGFEASLFATLSDELDGNAGSNKTNDMLMQGQFFVKRYLSPFPFWEKWFKK
ncbi:DUF6089 family protein [Echinicola rosea]|uniref:DUF6089 domain-containing protein n=1 Tax=Echinicola rosea TaxID=1807691 RepID=A0ABQ1UEH4_9BACT|nr:hypothetical protein [Echinicola rosea]GGF16745.1 hypothetical protein GCM10011339_00810 [Echinicola rosea]